LLNKAGGSILLFVWFFAPALIPIWDRVAEPGSSYLHTPILLILAATLAFRGLSSLKQKKLPQLTLGQSALSVAGIVVFSIATIYFRHQRIHYAEYLSLLSLFCLITYLFWGRSGLSSVRWAVAFTLIAMPLPSVCLVYVSYFLREISIRLSLALVSLIYSPVYRDGVTIHFSNYWVEIAEACSGLKTLITAVAVASVLAFLETDRKKQIAFFALSWPAAVFGNVLRILIVCIIISLGGTEQAIGSWHSPIGWMSFAAAMLALSFLIGLIPNQQLAEGKSKKRNEISIQASDSAQVATSKRSTFFAWTTIAVLTLACLLSWKVSELTQLESSDVKLALQPEEKMPGGWIGKDLALQPSDYEILGTNDLRLRLFHRSATSPDLYFFEMKSPPQQGAAHSPEICLKSEGYEMKETADLMILDRNRSWDAQRSVFEKGPDGLLMYHWYTVNGYRTGSYLLHHWRILYEMLRGHVVQARMDRITLPFPAGTNDFQILDAEAKEFILDRSDLDQSHR
jgi:EpsI family protein